MDLLERAWLDQQDAHVAALVRRYGWAIQFVSDEGCTAAWCDCRVSGGATFAYTIGLFGLGHPELLILGAPMATAGGVLNHLGKRVKDGEALVPGHLITFEAWPHRIVPEEVPNPGDIVFGANRFYRKSDDRSVPVLQLSYDDAEGRFPWEADYADPAAQPRPGTFRAPNC